jgi:hypothetical protein
MVLFNNLNIKQSSHERELYDKIGKSEMYITIEDNKYNVFKEKVKIMTADYTPIAVYDQFKIGDQEEYCWTWCKPMPEEIKNVLKSLPENLAFLDSDKIFTFTDPMIISFLHAFICDTVPYDYLYKQSIEGSFRLFGLKNIEWMLEVVEPSNCEN